MKCLLLFVLVFATGFLGNAQTPAETKMYSGRIANGQGDGVEYATVVLLQDTIQKAGTTTDDKGNFSLEAKAGAYEAVVQCIGYKTIRKNVTLPAPEPDTFSLQPSFYALKEVVVQAKNIERKADRFVISVSPSMGKDGTEFMQKIAGKDKDSIYRNNADATYDIVTSDISVRKSLREGLSLNAGLKYTYTFMDDNSCYENQDAVGQWSIDPAYGYTLRYNENIAGAYASFSADLNRWSLTAGLRGEYTRTSNRSDHLNEDYFDLFPNLNVTYAFNDLKTWMLVGQYARNIERPAFYTLNPNRLQTSDYSYNIGNPYLKPTYINRFSATLVYNYRYTLTIGGNLHSAKPLRNRQPGTDIQSIPYLELQQRKED